MPPGASGAHCPGGGRRAPGNSSVRASRIPDSRAAASRNRLPGATRPVSAQLPSSCQQGVLRADPGPKGVARRALLGRP
eukprot:2679738-Alexandrium_andersonii.AAC.1